MFTGCTKYCKVPFICAAWKNVFVYIQVVFYCAIADKKKESSKGKRGEPEPVPVVECTVFREDVCAGANILKDGEDPCMKVLCDCFFMHCEHWCSWVFATLIWTTSNFACMFLRPDLT